MSQITTHILDTSSGRPAAGVLVSLQQAVSAQSWATLGEGATNKDGRISNLLGQKTRLAPGSYRLIFQTGAYYQKQNIKTFYPEVKIIFQITDDSHYHVPLLLNPFGYTTYRGS